MIEAAVPGPVPRFELPAWRQYGVIAGITGRGNPAAPFDLGLGALAPAPGVVEHWGGLLASYPEFQSITVSRQVHGTEIRWQLPGTGLIIQEGADGHATESPGALLAVTVADCVPVYLLDPLARRAALLHAGWRGTAAGILPAGIALLKARGSSVENLLVHCGIGICGDCYEVGSEVFEACGLRPPNGRGRLDLRQVLLGQAREAGVREPTTSPRCSAHERMEFFSHRASGGADGRMVGYLGLQR